MKQLILLITVLGMTATSALAARMYPATGRVVDEQGAAVEYATVVLLKGTEQVAGMATDSEGRFRLEVPTGDYTLSIQYLGYDPLKQMVHVEQENDLGDFVMHYSSTEIEGVVVKAQLVRREADRFVVDVANAPTAAGRDGVELLERAPGVWVDSDKISVNGRTGTKVYVNDRELKLEPEQLLTYIRSLRAEEIQKIEVIPTTGADYDADTAGGVIRITLKKRRENGLNGSLSLNGSASAMGRNLTPGGNINIHSGRFDLYASGWGSFADNRSVSDETTRYTSGDAALTSHSDLKSRVNNGGGTLGALYEIAPHHSIGAEFEYWHNDSDDPTDTQSDFTQGDRLTRTQTRFGAGDYGDNLSATFNYVWKVDTLGSTLKLLADYTSRSNASGNDNFSRITSPAAVRDSTYRDRTTSRYTIASATLALDKKFSPRWTLKAGAKFTRNDMDNDALYEYLHGADWVRNDRQSFSIDYTENIAAAYGIVAANLGRWSLVAGLRGEYTHTTGKQVGQDYFSLFPNANISYSLSKDGAYSLIAQYARTISRPSFWSLSPQRSQISDYTYQTGNPALKPSYTHDASLTFVLKHKYTLTAGLTVETDEIQQTILPDADDPDLLCVAWVNYDAMTSYYLTASLPFQLTRWWQLNVNAMAMRHAQRVGADDPVSRQNLYSLYASTTFTLPANFYIDLSYRYQSRVELGNCWVEPQQMLHAGIKKRFGERFTLSFNVRNLTEEPQHIGARGEGFVRRVDVLQFWNNRQYRIGLTWNFKSGKAFRKKSVEAGSAEDRSRL